MIRQRGSEDAKCWAANLEVLQWLHRPFSIILLLSDKASVGTLGIYMCVCMHTYMCICICLFPDKASIDILGNETCIHTNVWMYV